MALLTAHVTAAALWLGMDTALTAITAAQAAIPAPVGAAVLTSSAAITLGTGFMLAAHRPWDCGAITGSSRKCGSAQ